MSMWNIKSSLEEWEAIARSIERELTESGFTERFKTSLMLAMDEIISNIVSYAYTPSWGNVVIKSEYIIESGKRIAAVTFTDFATKFNPLEDFATPDVTETVSTKMKVGGLGIFLAKKHTDELKYSYINDSNNLTLIKRETI